ncbi:Unknown protein sequence [Pseudomonas syringae pv. cilantro]|uniref:Uncharacterized protein n=1 Tax=Pseudomonas syringae pv. cilantro TaxID=81035 RepID=A0A0N0X9P7_PSESX|nr:Unknown protein sequence [Pseudomonas syringae pv. cilantro]
MQRSGHHAEFGHAADPGDQVQGQKHHVDQGQFAQQGVGAVADQIAPRAHQPGEHRGVDFRLFVALVVLDDHVVDQRQAEQPPVALLSAGAGLHLRPGLPVDGHESPATPSTP